MPFNPANIEEHRHIPEGEEKLALIHADVKAMVDKAYRETVEAGYPVKQETVVTEGVEEFVEDIVVYAAHRPLGKLTIRKTLVNNTVIWSAKDREQRSKKSKKDQDEE